MGKRRTAKEALNDLRKSIALGTRVLNVYSRDKHVHGRALHIYLFALYAKLIASARSMLILLNNNQLSDCPLLLRSLSDSALDVEFILSKPGEENQILKLLQIETAVDRYEQMEAHRRSTGKTLKEYVRLHPDAAERIRKNEWAKGQPEFNKKKEEWPKRWMCISGDEKREALKTGSPQVKYVITTIGNAFAHSRPIAVACFVKDNASENTVRFKTKLIPSARDSKKTAMYAALAVLCVGGQLAEQFNLGIALERRIARLGYQLAPNEFRADYESIRSYNIDGSPRSR